MFRVLKILAFQPDHVGAGAFVGFAVHVDLAVLHAAGLRIEHFVERQRVHFAVHEADDGAVFFGFGREQELDGGITEVARVFGVERDRVGAAEFVAEVLVNEGHFDAEFFEALAQKLLHQAAEFDFAETQMAVLVADNLAETFELAFRQRLDQTLFAHRFDEAFGEDDNAVLRTFGAALDDGADDDVANFIHRDLPVRGIPPE